MWVRVELSVVQVLAGSEVVASSWIPQTRETVFTPHDSGQAFA